MRSFPFDAAAPVPNPYTDPVSVQTEQDYVLSVVNRFKDVPWLCWDLINELSFSNPHRIFKGNVPNGDPTEVAAWHKWLREKYGKLEELAAAWTVTPEKMGSFDAIPLPSEADLTSTATATSSTYGPSTTTFLRRICSAIGCGRW
jgi:hypothetical protein